VAAYLALTAVITGVAFWELVRHPETIYAWKYALLTQHGNPWAIFGISLILFPRLALGLSGFETGVAIRPGGGEQNPIPVLAERFAPLLALPIGVFEEHIQIDEHFSGLPGLRSVSQS